jgi:hypothetical protein
MRQQLSPLRQSNRLTRIRVQDSTVSKHTRKVQAVKTLELSAGAMAALEELQVLHWPVDVIAEVATTAEQWARAHDELLVLAPHIYLMANHYVNTHGDPGQRQRPAS